MVIPAVQALQLERINEISKRPCPIYFEKKKACMRIRGQVITLENGVAS